MARSSGAFGGWKVVYQRFTGGPERVFERIFKLWHAIHATIHDDDATIVRRTNKAPGPKKDGEQAIGRSAAD